MSRIQLALIATGMAFALPALTAADASPRPKADVYAAGTVLRGTWRSATDEVPLTSAFEESVWGKGSKAVRVVQMTIQPSGDATLTVTRKVVDARGRTVDASTSVEHAELTLGAVQTATDVRSEFAVSVKHAERRYPDDPAATWTIDGLGVEIATRSDKPGAIEVRVDFPDGRGSFWEMLRPISRTVESSGPAPHRKSTQRSVSAVAAGLPDPPLL
jgi:hypothetical protein